MPFISYLEWIQNGNRDLFWENIYNLIMFIPFGFLIIWKMQYENIVVGECFFFVLIEVLQLIFCKGICELDDIINNEIGFVIGYSFAFLLKKILSGIICQVRRGG